VILEKYDSGNGMIGRFAFGRGDENEKEFDMIIVNT
jgi:hypothetical protein